MLSDWLFGSKESEVVLICFGANDRGLKKNKGKETKKRVLKLLLITDANLSE